MNRNQCDVNKDKALFNILFFIILFLVMLESDVQLAIIFVVYDCLHFFA